MATIGERITGRAFAALEAAPEGLRYSDLVRRVMELDGSFKLNTVNGTVWNLDERFPDSENIDENIDTHLLKRIPP